MALLSWPGRSVLWTRHERANRRPWRRHGWDPHGEPTPQGSSGVGRVDHGRRRRRPPRVPTRVAVRALRFHRSRGHRPVAVAPTSWRHRVPPERDRPRRSRHGLRLPGRRVGARLRRARRRVGIASRARGDRGPDRFGLDGEGVHVLRPSRRDGVGGQARHLRRWTPRRQRGRHADQVPGRAARVLLPRRLVLPRARHPRPSHDHLRDPPRRRVHHADRIGGARRDARGARDRAGDGVQHW